MRLTWRDGVATLFAGMGAAIVLAVARSWDWPLLGSYRAGIVALVVIGVPMCLIGGYAFWQSDAFENPAQIMKDPFLTIASILGFTAAGVMIVGLVTDDRALFLTLGALMGALWLVATTRHAVEGGGGIAIHRPLPQ